MEISSKLTAEELELKNKFKLLRQLKRSVDKLSSSRKRHFLCPPDDTKNQVKVVSSGTALNHLKSHQVTLKAKETTAVTEGFKKPVCWSRADRRPAGRRHSRAFEQQDFEEMYSRTDFREEHQTVVFDFGNGQEDFQHSENQHAEVHNESVNVQPEKEAETMVFEDNMDVQNDSLNQYAVEGNISPGNMDYTVVDTGNMDYTVVDNENMDYNLVDNEQYDFVEVATFQCTPDNSSIIVNYPAGSPQSCCIVQRYGDVVMQSNNWENEDRDENDEFTLSIVF